MSVKQLSLKELLNQRSKMNADTGCIEWVRAKSTGGYGQIRLNGKAVYAHRVAWELKNGPIPEGMHVLHKCDNRACINEDHLFTGTNADNVSDKCEKWRQPLGEQHGRSRLTEAEIKRIRSDARPQRVIASEYGVCDKHISRIRRRETWSHVA